MIFASVKNNEQTQCCSGGYGTWIKVARRRLRGGEVLQVSADQQYEQQQRGEVKTGPADSLREQAAHSV